MASPLETYLRKTKRNNALINVSRRGDQGGGSVYNKDDERAKIEAEYLANTKIPQAPEFKVTNSPAREARRYRDANRVQDEKIVYEASIRNQFDQARGVGGDIGLKQMHQIGMNNRDGVSIFDKMYKGEMTFNELASNLPSGNTPKPPSLNEGHSNQLDQMIANGVTMDDVRMQPGLKNAVSNASLKQQRALEYNTTKANDAMDLADRTQMESDARDKAYNQKRSMEEAAYKDKMITEGGKSYYGPGVDQDRMNLLAKDFVKYDDEAPLHMVSALMGDKDETGGLMGMLNIRKVLAKEGASKEQLAKFDDWGHSSRIKKMEKDNPNNFLNAEQLADKRNKAKLDEMMAVAPVSLSKGSKAKPRKKSKARELLLMAQRGGQKFASGLTTSKDDWRHKVAEGGFISKLGAGSKAVYDRYFGDAIASSRYDDIAEGDTSLDGAQIKHRRDALGEGKASTGDVAGKFLRQAAGDTVTGAGLAAMGIAGAPVALAKGAKALYDKANEGKADYEELAEGKKKGSLLQRLGKGMTFAGNAIDIMNADNPSLEYANTDMKFYDGKSDEKIKSIDMSEAGDVNKPVAETEEAVENPALEGSALKETNVQAKVDAAQKDIPSPLLTDEMDARTRQQLMVDAGLDIGSSGENKDGVDGDFGAKSEAAWKEYTSMVEGGDYTTGADGNMVYDFSGGTGNAIVPEITDYNRRVPGLPSITKQRGGFISRLINNRRAY
tara:strand:- start:6042 stop:8213 length:2172 start_codon:yes stop_codon:yes gene_type:complete